MAIYLGGTKQKLWLNNNSCFLKIPPPKDISSESIFLKTKNGELLVIKDGSYLTIKKED